MGENSGIQWTHHTFNGWWGCQRVSPGCQHCYAETLDKRVGGGVDPKDGVKKLRWGPLAPRIRTSAANWRKPLAWNAAAKKAGERHRVFCSSMADVFEDRPELVPWRSELFNLILETQHLDWLLLTKRPENIGRMTPRFSIDFASPIVPWPNIWFGTTVEDQQRANERIPELLKVPAVVRFLSIEPLLEAVELRHLLLDTGRADIGLAPLEPGQRVDWMIIGGESGGNARPFDLAWAADLVEQAREVGAAPFVKQMGSKPVTTRYRPGGGPVKIKFEDSAGGEMAEWPVDLRVREFPR